MAEEQFSIPSRAKQYTRLIKECPSALSDWAEEQHAQFRIWDSNLGISVRGHESFEYRIGPSGCHDPKPYRLISQLLDACIHNLRLRECCSRTILLRIVLVWLTSCFLIQVKQLELKLDPGVLKSLVATLTQPNTGPDYNSLGSEDEDPGDPSGSSMLIDVESALAQQLRSACFEVEDSTMRLGMISSTIRRPGAAYREERARKFIDIVTFGRLVDGNIDPMKDLAKEGDLNSGQQPAPQSGEIKDNASKGPKEPDQGGHAGRNGAKPSKDLHFIDRADPDQFKAITSRKIDSMFPDADAWLRERLTNTIYLRRNYLAYLKRNYQRLDQKQEGNWVSEDDRISDHGSREASQSGAANTPSERGSVYSGGATSLSTPSGTSTLSVSHRILNIPPPRVIYKDTFLCPYCHVLCDKEDSRGKRWQ